MLSRRDLLALLRTVPAVEHLRTSAVPGEGVSGNSLRASVHGQPAVIAGTSQKHQFSAVMDLVHLYLGDRDRKDGVRHLRPGADPNAVTFIYLEDNPPNQETEDALRTVVASVATGPRIRLMSLSVDGQLRDVSGSAMDLGDINKYRYTNWPGLLSAVKDEPPGMLVDVSRRAANPALRAYPRLTGGNWSLRLEGLEVGRFKGDRATLTVGRDGKNGPGKERQLWIEAAGTVPLKLLEGSDHTLDAAVQVLKAFAGTMMPPFDRSAPSDQNEHALESRVLRGMVPLTTQDGTTLTLLKPRHEVVNWGSQFPTRWGRTNGGSGRYLDALLRDGRTPWAVEIKVERPSLGVTSYYRQAITQAILYRQFIQTATPLASWFAGHGLDQLKCRAAVVVPELANAATSSEDLRKLGKVFNIELIEVEPHFAERRTLTPQ